MQGQQFISRTIGVCAVAILVGSCGPSEEPLGPGPDTGPLTAYIDGVPYIAATASVTRVRGVTTVNAAGQDGALELEFEDVGQPWNYVIGTGNPVAATLTVGTTRWTADSIVGAGTITITDNFPSLLSGSFQLTLTGPAPQVNVEVTTGRFQIIG